ncbi:hypothetical protein [Sphingomonas hengshuiensis]|uniref:hypothetical protein n=1 Tax=Sphingomonas hengshuiensis TaxID=1609977 RepID=UPI000A8FC264|nr:hypothetical protein [Sphingomonas hengshuiensis]
MIQDILLVVENSPPAHPVIRSADMMAERLREVIFGAVTRNLLDKARLPLQLAW